MDERKITNKRMSVQNIFELAEMIQQRCDYFDNSYQERKALNDFDKEEEYDKNHQYSISTKPYVTYAIVAKDKHSESRDNDLEWFKQFITFNKKEIERITISYYATYYKGGSDARKYGGENLNITIYEDDIIFYCHKENELDILNFDAFAQKIDNIFESLPPRLNATISRKYIRCNVPSLTIGYAVGIIAALVLGLLCRFSNINIYINDFVNQTHYFMLAVFGISFAFGLLIPGVNHSLYRKIKIKKMYVGYNYTSRESIYTEDLENFRNQCEVEIGDYSDYPAIRAKIEANYKKSKWILLIELCIFAVAWVVLALI